jgi:AcrR family transcriptional regulator
MATTPRLRREEVLDGLVGLFLKQGFRGFTLADLAAELHCSKTTLYTLGHSKEAVVRNVLVHFFRGATQSIEARIAGETEPSRRIGAYLRAVADELRPASPHFFADIAANPDARAVYERNTRIAAERISQMIAAGVKDGAFRTVDAAFVADLVASETTRIQTGAVRAATGLGDADAYDALAELVLRGIASRNGPR